MKNTITTLISMIVICSSSLWAPCADWAVVFLLRYFVDFLTSQIKRALRISSSRNGITEARTTSTSHGYIKIYCSSNAKSVTMKKQSNLTTDMRRESSKIALAALERTFTNRKISTVRLELSFSW